MTSEEFSSLEKEKWSLFVVNKRKQDMMFWFECGSRMQTNMSAVVNDSGLSVGFDKQEK